MHIALYHWGRLPPADYGGTERVVTWLARGLAELGHRVTLVAGRGSRVPEATVIEVDPAQAKTKEFDLRPLLPAGVEILLASAPVRNDPGVPYIQQLHGNSAPGVSYHFGASVPPSPAIEIPCVFATPACAIQ